MHKFLFLLFINLIINNHLFANQLIKTLDERMKKVNSLVCVGLDPDLNKIPTSINELKISDEDKVYKFLTEVVKITAPHTAAYKIQKAFFDQFDNGHVLLKNIVLYIHKNHKDVLVFVDCKIGDVDNTMKAYMQNIFKSIKADGVVINPYMGDDVLEPFIKDRDKLGIVLVQTSNPNAKVVQDLTLKNGKKLWEEMLGFVINRWNVNQNLIPVLSSNVEYLDYVAIRKKIPQNMPILLAGIGLQGGNPQILKQLLNKDNRGVLVNSSRGILYPYDPKNHNWQESVLQSVVELKNTLNQLRC